MNVKEWLEKEKDYYILFEGLTDKDGLISKMERYANYKTKELEAKILDWRQNYLKNWSEMENSEAEFAEYLLNQFDLHFNLTIERNGTNN